ncbi:MAG TPA: ribonuclease H-like domain-containing protein [Vicinamibacterales bacterium]|nr:ribonuclease H-like domain-containing protein [Vicinamibacterales bacterium]
MDSTSLSARLRSIVGGSSVRRSPDTKPAREDAVQSGAHRLGAPAEEILGGEWCRRDGLSCFVVDRRFEPTAQHGHDRVEALGTRLTAAFSQAALILELTDSAGAIQPPMVFFDLETTGLSGGAGTLAFLVGCGWFADDGAFVTRQFVLLRHADERELLMMVGHELARAGVLVSFNGKSFDAPLIETRHLFHRLPWGLCRLPHLDVLHSARRFWGDSTGSGCSLAVLETQVLGARRSGDVPGPDIPARYFEFVHTGDAGPLAEILWHNRLDLLSLAGLTSRLLDLVRGGPATARDAGEALALGRLYARCGLTLRAEEAYELAFAAGSALVRRDAARALALLCRRARRWDDAAAFWQELLATPSCPPHFAREANQALAVHHEHRVRDLATAKAFALASLGSSPRTPHQPASAWTRAVRHRLGRIERKLGNSQVSRLNFDSRVET